MKKLRYNIKTSSAAINTPDRDMSSFNSEHILGCDDVNIPDRNDLPSLDGSSDSILRTAQTLELSQDVVREALDRAAGVKTASITGPEIGVDGNYQVVEKQKPKGRHFLSDILAGTRGAVGDWATPGRNERYNFTTRVSPTAYQLLIPEYRR